MSITMRDIAVAKTQWREVQTSVDAIGQAMRAWDHRLQNQLAAVGHVHTIGRALDAPARNAPKLRAVQATAAHLGVRDARQAADHGAGRQHGRPADEPTPRKRTLGASSVEPGDPENS